jgi:hypothetical protein
MQLEGFIATKQRKYLIGYSYTVALFGQKFPVE